MDEEFSVRQISLRYPEERRRLEQFLAGHALRMENDVEAAFGIFDGNDALVGSGCAARWLLKGFAVNEELRGQNALGSLVSALTQERFAAGYYDLCISTRAHNRPLFEACGFHVLAETDDLCVLENRTDGPEAFCRELKENCEGTVGALVMKCDPFTLGHQHLAAYAAEHCELLHIFVVESEKTMFSTADRIKMVKNGTAHLQNVRVHPAGRYMISPATFPTYFLKEGENAAALQSALDITLFAGRIAPVMGIRHRFAGEEPLDATTACYNRTMERILPANGIGFTEIPRLGRSDEVVSASRVRALLHSDRLDEAMELLPPTTQVFLRGDIL